MANNNLLKFLNQISNNKKLMSEFFENKNLKDLYNFALQHSEGGFSEQELQEALDMMEIYSNKLKKGELSEKNLENISGGVGDETNLRSIAMMAGPIVQLILGGGSLLSNWLEAKTRYNNSNDKLRIKELEKELEEFKKSKETTIILEEKTNY